MRKGVSMISRLFRRRLICNSCSVTAASANLSVQLNVVSTYLYNIITPTTKNSSHTVCGACKVGKLVPLFSVVQRAPRTPKTKADSRLAANKSHGKHAPSLLVCQILMHRRFAPSLTRRYHYPETDGDRGVAETQPRTGRSIYRARSGHRLGSGDNGDGVSRYYDWRGW